MIVHGERDAGSVMEERPVLPVRSAGMFEQWAETGRSDWGEVTPRLSSRYQTTVWKLVDARR